MTGELIRHIKKYENDNSVPPPGSWWKSAPGYDNKVDDKNRYDGDDYSFINYVGHKKLGIKGMSAGINLFNESMDFGIPIYLIQGINDLLTPEDITKEHFDKIKAPVKRLFVLPGTALINQFVVDTQFKILKEYLSH
jgi:hypothetical protein